MQAQADAKESTKPKDDTTEHKDIDKETTEESQIDPDDIEFDIEKKIDPEDKTEEGEEEEGEEEVDDEEYEEEEYEERIVYKNEHLEELNEDGKQRVYALRSLQKLKNNILLKYKEELEEIDRKFDNILQPNYRERDEIAFKELPYFWYYAMRNNAIISETTNLCEADKPIFKFLKRVFCTPFPREMCQVPETDKIICKLGFDVVFEFAPGNPFFEESVLVKSYYLVEDDPSGDPIFDSAESTEITWKEDYKDNNDTFNFFQNFFKSSQLPLDSDSQEEIEELTEIIQRDFEVGRELRDKVCPNAYLWYTGDVEDNVAEEFSTEDLKEDEGDDVGAGDTSELVPVKEDKKEEEDSKEDKETTK